MLCASVLSSRKRGYFPLGENGVELFLVAGTLPVLRQVPHLAGSWVVSTELQATCARAPGMSHFFSFLLVHPSGFVLYSERRECGPRIPAPKQGKITARFLKCSLWSGVRWEWWIIQFPKCHWLDTQGLGVSQTRRNSPMLPGILSPRSLHEFHLRLSAK